MGTATIRRAHVGKILIGKKGNRPGPAIEAPPRSPAPPGVIEWRVEWRGRMRRHWPDYAAGPLLSVIQVSDFGAAWAAYCDAAECPRETDMVTLYVWNGRRFRKFRSRGVETVPLAWQAAPTLLPRPEGAT